MEGAQFNLKKKSSLKVNPPCFAFSKKTTNDIVLAFSVSEDDSTKDVSCEEVLTFQNKRHNLELLMLNNLQVPDTYQY